MDETKGWRKRRGQYRCGQHSGLFIYKDKEIVESAKRENEARRMRALGRMG